MMDDVYCTGNQSVPDPTKIEGKHIHILLAPIPTSTSIEIQLLLLKFWFSSRISYHSDQISNLKPHSMVVDTWHPPPLLVAGCYLT